MVHEKLNRYRLVLASASPRRQQLLKELGLNFDIRIPRVEESYPDHLQREEIAVYLSRLKAESFPESELAGYTILIAADTIVWLDGEVLPKPQSFDEAVRILSKLSGKAHDVITGVSLRNSQQIHSFYSLTRVYFRALTQDEITYYVNVHKPFDKAGAYGIQEWIGYAGVEKIEGSYYNVMGLPVEKLYAALQAFSD